MKIYSYDDSVNIGITSNRKREKFLSGSANLQYFSEGLQRTFSKFQTKLLKLQSVEGLERGTLDLD